MDHIGGEDKNISVKGTKIKNAPFLSLPSFSGAVEGRCLR